MTDTTTTAFDTVDSENYRRLGAWYVARLRRAQLTETSSISLGPSMLLDADQRQLIDRSSKDKRISPVSGDAWKRLRRCCHISTGTFLAITVPLVIWFLLSAGSEASRPVGLRWIALLLAIPCLMEIRFLLSNEALLHLD